MNHQINEEQEDFLYRLLVAFAGKNSIKACSNMQILIRERDQKIKLYQKKKCADNLINFANSHFSGLEFSDDDELRQIIMESE